MDDGVIIAVVGILMPTVLVPMILTMKHRQKRREWEHQERLRAIEMGLPPVGPEPKLGAGAVLAIGAGVPAVAVIAALATTAGIPYTHKDYLPIIAVAWGCSFLISTAALIAGLVLGVLVLRANRTPAATSDDPVGACKPAYDPDAYDVVSRRG